mmetsp:Transcript_16600/g.35653  ORF Transcript_16600/g.35653 Transcript_16600/m.35653 type:complete len:211 (-) Transcript_16600:311-943(-)
MAGHARLLSRQVHLCDHACRQADLVGDPATDRARLLPARAFPCRAFHPASHRHALLHRQKRRVPARQLHVLEQARLGAAASHPVLCRLRAALPVHLIKVVRDQRPRALRHRAAGYPDAGSAAAARRRSLPPLPTYALDPRRLVRLVARLQDGAHARDAVPRREAMGPARRTAPAVCAALRLRVAARRLGAGRAAVPPDEREQPDRQGPRP